MVETQSYGNFTSPDIPATTEQHLMPPPMNAFDLVALPVDGSRSSYVAFELAKLFFSSESSLKITPIHVWGDWQPYVFEVLFPFAPMGEDLIDFEVELGEVASRYLYRSLKTTSDDPILNAPVVVRGNCRTDLSKIFLTQGFDLIAIGASGRGVQLSSSVGSVVTEVVRGADIPVLIGRPSLVTPKIAHITVPIDLTSNSHRLIEEGVRLAYQLSASIDILYVFPDPLVHQHNKILYQAIGADPATLLERVEGQINAAFDALVRKIDVAYSRRNVMHEAISTRFFRQGDVVTEITSHCEERGTDLIVLGKHDLSCANTKRIGTVTRGVMESSPCHLYIVPTTGKSDID